METNMVTQMANQMGATVNGIFSGLFAHLIIGIIVGAIIVFPLKSALIKNGVKGKTAGRIAEGLFTLIVIALWRFFLTM
jgi:hypothetical protein